MPQGPIPTLISALNPANASTAVRSDAQGSLPVAPRHADHYSAAYAGTVGLVAATGVTLSAALATTYTGLCLSNPAGSGKNLSIYRVTGSFDVAPAALTALGLIVGYAAAGIVTHTTPLTPLNGLIGVTTPALVGLADAACTLVGTPAWARWIAQNLGATNETSFDENVNGEILLPPGAYMAIGASIAGPTAGFYGSISWEENPV